MSCPSLEFAREILKHTKEKESWRDLDKSKESKRFGWQKRNRISRRDRKFDRNSFLYLRTPASLLCSHPGPQAFLELPVTKCDPCVIKACLECGRTWNQNKCEFYATVKLCVSCSFLLGYDNNFMATTYFILTSDQDEIHSPFHNLCCTLYFIINKEVGMSLCYFHRLSLPSAYCETCATSHFHKIF